MQSIYIHKDGKQLGPFTEKQIQGRLYSEELSREDLAWHEGLEGWISVSELLKPKTPPPLPVSSAHPASVIGVPRKREPLDFSPKGLKRKWAQIKEEGIKDQLILIACIAVLLITVGMFAGSGNRPESGFSVNGTTGVIRKSILGSSILGGVKTDGRAMAVEVYQAAIEHAALTKIIVKCELVIPGGGLVDSYGNRIEGPYLLEDIEVTNLDEVRKYANQNAYANSHSYWYVAQLMDSKYARFLKPD